MQSWRHQVSDWGPFAGRCGLMFRLLRCNFLWVVIGQASRLDLNLTRLATPFLARLVDQAWGCWVNQAWKLCCYIRFLCFKISVSSKNSLIDADLHLKLQCKFRKTSKQYRLEQDDSWLDLVRFFLNLLNSAWPTILIMLQVLDFFYKKTPKMLRNKLNLLSNFSNFFNGDMFSDLIIAGK